MDAQPLADSANRYRLLANNTPDMVALVEPDGAIVWASPSTTKVLGYEPTDLIGANTADLAHFEDLRELLTMRSICDAGEITQGQIRFLSTNGEYRWMSLILSPALDEEERVVGRIDILRDVHEQVLMREALTLSERMFRLAMDGAPHGMAVVALHRSFMQVNKVLCTMLGRDQHWLLSHTISDVLHPDDVEGDLALRDKLLGGAQPQLQRECRWLNADGSPIWASHSISLLRDQHQMPLFYVSHIQPITDERRPGTL